MNKKCMIGGILFSLLSLTLYGQEKDPSHHVFSVQAGYGNLFKSSKLLTRNTDAYRSKLRDGIAWNASYYYQPIPDLGIGILYTGQTSESAHTEGADQLYTHYFAPQFAVHPVNSKRFSLGLHVGAGLLMFRNNSEVFGKDRIVKSSSLGFNAGLKAEFKLSSHWGIGVDCLFITSDALESKVDYHNETIDVEQPNYLRPFSVTGGLNYRF